MVRKVVVNTKLVKKKSYMAILKTSSIEAEKLSRSTCVDHSTHSMSIMNVHQHAQCLWYTMLQPQPWNGQLMEALFELMMLNMENEYKQELKNLLLKKKEKGEEEKKENGVKLNRREEECQWPLNYQPTPIIIGNRRALIEEKRVNAGS
ncbi:hypothetical protein QYF36_017746 [Acer negundo]|nr:hypothetical protein QYF36_017746 [Acer negundo]